VFAHLAGVVDLGRLNALLDTLLHPDFNAFLPPPVDDLGHVSLLQFSIQFVLFHAVQSTLDDPEGKQESNAFLISGLEEGDGHIQDGLHTLASVHVRKKGQGNSVGGPSIGFHLQGGDLHQACLEDEIGVSVGSAQNGVLNVMGLVVVDQGNRQDLVQREAAAKVQVVTGGAEKIELVGGGPVLHKNNQESWTFVVFEALSFIAPGGAASLLLRLGRRGLSLGPARPQSPAQGTAGPAPWESPGHAGGLPSPCTPARLNGSRGEVGGSSEIARPPARRCAVVAGGVDTVWFGGVCRGVVAGPSEFVLLPTLPEWVGWAKFWESLSLEVCPGRSADGAVQFHREEPGPMGC